MKDHSVAAAVGDSSPAVMGDGLNPLDHEVDAERQLPENSGTVAMTCAPEPGSMTLDSTRAPKG